MRTLIPMGEWQVVLPLYLAWLASQRLPKTTQKLRSYHLRRFATTTQLEPFAVTLADLQAWVDRPDWSKATARSYRTTFRSFYKWARKFEYIAESPAVELETIRVPLGVPRPAPEDAIQHGITKADQRTRLMIRLGAEAGLRCCEIAQVHTQDVRKEFDGYYLLVHGKGDKQRLVPIEGALARRILGAGDGYVFPGQIDGHLSAGYVSKLISRALPQGITAHPLRHRFGSVAYLGSGGDLRAVQELLGHASVATTQIYTMVPDGNKRRAVAAAAW